MSHIYENDTKPILSDPPYLLQFILSVALSVLCGATIMFMWNWFVVPLGLPVIGLVQALGLDTLITFIVTTRVNTNPDPFWDRWITAITYDLWGCIQKDFTTNAKKIVQVFMDHIRPMCKKLSLSDVQIAEADKDGRLVALPSDKALTNADRMRAATNQQLAKLLYDNQKEFCRLMYKNLGFEDELTFSEDYSDILAWLNAPAEMGVVQDKDE